jgi:hypothetical protein
MNITDHLFIPQSRISNMCVCGEAMSVHGDPTPVVTSFHMETSQGGIPITMCACGLLIYQPMATTHMRTCDAYRRTLRTETVS